MIALDNKDVFVLLVILLSKSGSSGENYHLAIRDVFSIH